MVRHVEEQDLRGADQQHGLDARRIGREIRVRGTGRSRWRSVPIRRSTVATSLRTSARSRSASAARPGMRVGAVELAVERALRRSTLSRMSAAMRRAARPGTSAGAIRRAGVMSYPLCRVPPGSDAAESLLRILTKRKRDGSLIVLGDLSPTGPRRDSAAPRTRADRRAGRAAMAAGARGCSRHGPSRRRAASAPRCGSRSPDGSRTGCPCRCPDSGLMMNMCAVAGLCSACLVRDLAARRSRCLASAEAR